MRIVRSLTRNQKNEVVQEFTAKLIVPPEANRLRFQQTRAVAKLGKANLDPPLTEIASSPWSPFRHAIFTVIWIATVVSNIGGWMYSAASGWLMTSLNPDPLIVSLVQVANTLPMFLFAVPAGALADIRRQAKVPHCRRIVDLGCVHDIRGHRLV